MSERIQKVLAACGIASRRKIEEMIKEKRITVNGKIAELGEKISLRDRVKIDGKPYALPKAFPNYSRVLIYYKPEGEVCTRSDPENRPCVFDKLPKIKQRWINIGRLDLNTSGLLLFTTDGELAKRLMHPSYEVEREYAVRVLGTVTKTQTDNLLKGVKLEDGPAHFTSIQEAGGSGANTWYHVIIKEGRTREVRRLWESQGLTVSRLIRIRFGNIALPRYLQRGQSFELDPKTVLELEALVGYSHS